MANGNGRLSIASKFISAVTENPTGLAVGALIAISCYLVYTVVEVDRVTAVDLRAIAERMEWHHEQHIAQTNELLEELRRMVEISRQGCLKDVEPGDERARRRCWPEYYPRDYR